jgi:hypothetical protein
VRFHDFHLRGYTVSDFGGTIVLDLFYDYPDQPRETSRIKFSDVAAYHFVHTGGAIIVGILEVAFSDLTQQAGDRVTELWRLHGGYTRWDDDCAKYIETLEHRGYHAWMIESAIGFQGLIIAKRAEQAEDENHPKT